MKKRSGLLSAVSILLVIALVAGIGGSLIASGRTRPDNPIDAQPEQLRAESLQGSGNTGRTGFRKGERPVRGIRRRNRKYRPDPGADGASHGTGEAGSDGAANGTDPGRGGYGPISTYG